jgi:hypothetical protein
MGSVSFFYPSGKPFIIRAWVKGFTAHPSINFMELTGSIIHMKDTVGHYEWFLQIWENFFEPTSNNYSLDYVFDESRCYFYSSGIITPNTNPLWLGFIPNEFEWRIGMSNLNFTANGLTVDFPVLSDYWRPLT